MVDQGVSLSVVNPRFLLYACSITGIGTLNRKERGDAEILYVCR